ncbi:MAG TPA: outer membrane beta-barrel protein [Gemmatimonadaceae bacterium]|nr:outer membrane beta-barrel protein [Gemmatimonadaceae bacterium]
MHSYFTRGALAAAVLLAAAPVAAQSRTPVRSTGFILGIGLGGTNFSPEDGDGTTGGGGNLDLGWGFTPRFAVLLGLNGAAFEWEGVSDRGNEDMTLAHVDLLARYSFHSPTSIYVPYVEGGITRRAFSSNDDDVPLEGESGKLEYSGNALTVGGGINFFFNQALALDLGARVSLGKFDTIKFRGTSVTDEGFELDATTTRFTLGLTWYPMKGRQ